MNESHPIQCPYCGEKIYIETEPTTHTVEYVEDCHVCCRPILVQVNWDESGLQLHVRRENE